MPRLEPPAAREIDHRAFYVILTILTLAFAWVIWPFFGAVMWGAILALLFRPIYLRLLHLMGERPNLAALATLTLVVVLVILPVVLVAVSLLQEITGLYARVKSGEVNFGHYFDQIVAALPAGASGLMDRLGLGDLASLQSKLTAALAQRGDSLAKRAVDFGSDTIDLVIGFCIAIYLLFFLLRDGSAISRRVRDAIPLAPQAKANLLVRFTTMVRATVKGNVVIAIMQGALGGIAFWILGIHAPLLWAVVMAFLSLLPAIGAALIWVPVALYLLATGQVWQGVSLIAFGVLVIGLVDNVLRPILVGKDTRMPDYLVLITTIGGLAVFGINGFVIGPVIAAMFISAWDLLTAERHGGPPAGAA